MPFNLGEYVERRANLPPEIEEGNVEYKWKLQPENLQRRQQLTSQLKWRLTEHGECFYFLGVEDDGSILGIPEWELAQSLKVLQEMCQDVKATISNIDKKRISRRPELYAAQVGIRLNDQSTVRAEQQRRMVKIAFVGASNDGKSTLVGTLSSGELDNGNGSVRLALLRHRHEVLSGRTSSVAVEFLPFDNETKQPIRVDHDALLEPISVDKQLQLLSTGRVAQLLDLAGDVRYQKSTFTALTSWAAPDWMCLVHSVTSPLDELRDWIALILTLELPFFVVISKTDLVLERTALDLTKTISDLIITLRRELFGANVSPYAVSIYRVSAVTGDGVSNLISNIYRLHQRRNVRLLNYLIDQHQREASTCPPDSVDANHQIEPKSHGRPEMLSKDWVDGESPTEITSPYYENELQALFCVEEVQLVPDVGIVLMGSIVYGSFELSKPLTCFLGPTKYAGQFVSVKIVSCRRMRISVGRASAGQMITMAIAGPISEAEIHRAMMVSICAGLGSGIHPPRAHQTDAIQAEVILNREKAPLIEFPTQGTLYWMGTRWKAQLITLGSVYGELRHQAVFKLLDALAWPLPGTRLIFVVQSEVLLSGMFLNKH